MASAPTDEAIRFATAVLHEHRFGPATNEEIVRQIAGILFSQSPNNGDRHVRR